MEKLPVSVTIITLNEEKDLPRALKSVQWASEVIVVDSQSSDRTPEIAKAHGAKVVDEKWRGYGAQKNFAMNQCGNEWILNIDADEEVTEDLKKEIAAIIQNPKAANVYAVARKTYYLGRWIRFGGWYPNYVTRLCRKSKSRWTEPAVHEELKAEGQTEMLKNPLNHYTFENIADQVSTNVKYAKQGAENLRKKGRRFSFFLLLVKPPIKFLETYIFKLGCLDGLAGFIISINAAHSMFMKYAFLYEDSLHEKQKNLSHR